jgi:hypothetical protein
VSADPPIQYIKKTDQVYAIVVRASLPPEGFNFVSRNDDSLQLGVNHYKKGGRVNPHMHLPIERLLINTLEVLHIDQGAVSLELFDEGKQRFYATELRAGDTVVLIRGGHALSILDDTRIVEVKQGPYLGPEKDKFTF